MRDSEREPDLFTQALRADLPNERDEARIKARLIAAGVLAGATVVTPSTAAAASGGFFSKLASLPLALKVGASVVVVGAAAVPVLQGVASSGRANVPDAPAVAPAPRPAVLQRAQAEARAVPAPIAATPVVLPAPERESPRAELAEVRPAPPVRAAAPPAAARRASSPAVVEAGVAAPVDEGTLRAETALMERALAALRRDDFTTAERELAAHAATFPNGHLRPERERALSRLRGKETER